MPHPKHPHQPETKKQILVKLRVAEIALAVTVGLLLAAGVTVWQTRQDDERRLELREQAMHPNGTIGGPFTLTDENGKTVHDTDYRGKFLLVYFGYTYCPDLCPTGLDGIAHALDRLGSDARKVQPLFITVDPARDTPEKLKEYTATFNPDIIGLTGTPDQIADVARAYQVYYAKGDNVEDGQYIMDHSNLIYVMDPEGKFVTSFPEDVDPAGMADALRSLWKKPGKPAKVGP